MSDESAYGDEYSDESTFDVCANCRQMRTLICCPNYGEVIERTFVPDEICEECCESLFDSGCINYIEDCSRVKEIQTNLIEQYALKNKLEKSNKGDEVYLNSSHTLAVIGPKGNLNKVTKEELLI